MTSTPKVVRATIGKWYQGKYCYQFTPNAPINGFSIGLATADYPLQPQTFPLYLGATAGIEGHISAGTAPGGGVYYVNHLYGAADPLVNGKAGMLCADLTATPPAIWITPDVTGTGGPGGGPKWNGDPAANPVGDVNGALIYFPVSGRKEKSLNQCCYFPAFQAQNGDSVTANFTSFTPPPGYQVWDNVNGLVPATPAPNPWTPLVVKVSNAPGWQPNNAYFLGNRINAGPAWNGGGYTNGLDLCTWAVAIPGTSGSDRTVFNDPCSNGTPALYGGDENGNIPTQWANATRVTSGSSTLVLLSKIDYVTLTGAAGDDDVIWTPNTNYGERQYVIDASGPNGKAYRNISQNTSVDPQCTSAAAGPFNPAADGAVGVGYGQCSWQYMGDITYSSKKNIFLHWSMVPGMRGGNARFYSPVVLQLWYGGNLRNQYQNSLNGEADQMQLINHNGTDGELFASPYHIGLGTTAGGCSVGDGNCSSLDNSGAWIYIRAAPGDSIKENFRSGVDALRYDPNRGVAIYSNLPYVDGNWVQYGTPLNNLDAGVKYQRVQMKSEYGWGSSHNTSSTVFQDVIVEGAKGAIDTTISATVFNSLMITHGQTGLYGKYRIGMSQSTLICDPSVPNSIGIAAFNGAGLGWPWSPQTGGPPFYNNLILGCKVDQAVGSNDFGTPQPPPYGWTDPFYSGGNATDIANPGQSVTNTWADYPSQNVFPFTSFTFGGYGNTCGSNNAASCAGLNPADVVVNPTPGPNFDARLKSNSPAKGAGVNYSFPMVPGNNSGRWWGWMSDFDVNNWAQVPVLTPPPIDIFGVPRQ